MKMSFSPLLRVAISSNCDDRLQTAVALSISLCGMFPITAVERKKKPLGSLQCICHVLHKESMLIQFLPCSCPQVTCCFLLAHCSHLQAGCFISEYKHYPSIFSLLIIKKYIAFFCSHHQHHYQQHQFISFLLLYFLRSNHNPAHLQVTPEEYTPNIYWLFSATTTNQCQLRHQRRWSHKTAASAAVS